MESIEPETPSTRDELIAAGLLRPARRSRRRLPPLWPELEGLPESVDLIRRERDAELHRT